MQALQEGEKVSCSLYTLELYSLSYMVQYTWDPTSFISRIT